MAIVRLKRLKDEKQVRELLSMFTLQSVDYSKGYQAKPRPAPVGASALPKAKDPCCSITAVQELLRRTMV